MATVSPQPHVFVDFVDDVSTEVQDWFSSNWYSLDDYVQTVTSSRGRKTTFEDIEAGSLDLVLDNSTGAFDIFNTSGPFYGNLKPRKRVLVAVGVDAAFAATKPSLIFNQMAIPLAAEILHGSVNNSFFGPASGYTVTGANMVVPAAVTGNVKSAYAGSVTGATQVQKAHWNAALEATGMQYTDASGTYTDQTTQCVGTYLNGSGYATGATVAGYNDLTDTFSLHVMIRPETLASRQAIYANSQFRLSLETNGSLAVYSSGGSALALTSSGVITANAWHQVVVSKSGTAAGCWQIWVNGTELTLSIDGAFSIGACGTWFLGTTTATAEKFTGTIGRFTVWRARALTTRQVQSIYGDLTRGFSSVNYRLDFHPLFKGYVESWPQLFTGQKASTITVNCHDAFALLQGIKIPAPYELGIKTGGVKPYSWWRLDELNGISTMADYSGNAHNGTYLTTTGSVAGLFAPYSSESYGARTWSVTGVLPATTQYAGAIVSDPGAALPNLGYYNGGPTQVSSGRSVSVEYWYKSIGTTTPSNISLAWFTVFAQTDAAMTVTGQSNNHLWVGIDAAGRPAIQSNNSLVFTYASGANVCDGNVHHVVCTYNGLAAGATGNASASIYIDGVPQVTGFSVINAPGQYGDFGQGVGATPVAANVVDYVSYCYGTLDEVAVYTSALSASQVAAHYAAGANRFSADTVGQRISRVLSYCNMGEGYSSGAYVTGSASLYQAVLTANPSQAYSSIGPAYDLGIDGSSAVDYLRMLIDTEQGDFYFDRSGIATFVPRNWPVVALDSLSTSARKFGDLANYSRYGKYDAMELDYNYESVRNSVEANTTLGVKVPVSDAGSIGTYGLRDFKFDIASDSSGYALALGQWIVDYRKNPQLRVFEISVVPTTFGQFVLLASNAGREFGALITTQGTSAGGFSVEDTYRAIGTSFTFDARTQKWQWKMMLDSLNVADYLVLDDAVLGRLDQGNKLLFF